MSLESDIAELRGRFAEAERARDAADARFRNDMDEIFTRLRALEGAKERSDGVVNGVTIALSKIGAAFVLVFAVIGWLLVNGVPEFVKRAFH